MDNASPIAAEGLPYLISSFTVTARGASTADFDAAESDGTPLRTVAGIRPSKHTDQLPLDLSVLTFARGH